MRKLCLNSGGRALLLIYLKRVTEDPGNYSGITLLSVVGKVFCKILKNRLVQCLDKERVLHIGQAGFRINSLYAKCNNCPSFAIPLRPHTHNV